MTNKKIDRALKNPLEFFCPGGEDHPSWRMIFDRAGRKLDAKR
jgi:hypothetical protein